MEVLKTCQVHSLAPLEYNASSSLQIKHLLAPSRCSQNHDVTATYCGNFKLSSPPVLRFLWIGKPPFTVTVNFSGFCGQVLLCNTDEIIFVIMGTRLSSVANCLGEASLTALAASWDQFWTTATCKGGIATGATLTEWCAVGAFSHAGVMAPLHQRTPWLTAAKSNARPLQAFTVALRRATCRPTKSRGLLWQHACRVDIYTFI